MVQRDLQRVVIGGKDGQTGMEIRIPQIVADVVELGRRIGGARTQSGHIQIQFAQQVPRCSAYVGDLKRGFVVQLLFGREVEIRIRRNLEGGVAGGRQRI